VTLHGLSDAFLTAVAGSYEYDREILLKSPAGLTLKDITADVTGGSVQVDETREIRRTLSLTMAATSDLIPSAPGDLLHPATGNELWVSRGVKYADGSTEMAPLGVFRTSKPATADGAALTFSMAGNDRAAVVASQGWQAPYQVQTGSNPGAAIQTALDFKLHHIYGELDYSGIAVTSFSFPAATWGATSGQSNDPMSDFQSFAAAAGCELFFDVNGNPIFRPIVNAALVKTPNDAVHFVEGPECVMTDAQRTLDETNAYNGVKLTCNGPGAAGPFIITVWDVDPHSPTYYLGPWGQKPYQMTTTLIPAGADDLATAQGKATYMASQQLQLILGAIDNLSVSCSPNPALQEGDVLRVVRGRQKIGANYTISGMTIPLDAQGKQSITFRPQVSAA
jgi:hypothetical protein